jgi:hypothetical protein
MPSVVFDASGFENIFRELKRIEAAGQKTTTIKFNSNVSQAELDVKRLTSKKIPDKTVNVNANTNPAQQSINRLSSQKIPDKNVNLTATDRISGTLSGLSSKFGTLGRQAKDSTGMATQGIGTMGQSLALAGGGMIGIQKGTDILQEFAKAGVDLAKQKGLAKDLYGDIPPQLATVATSMRMSKADTLKLINDFGLLAKGQGLTGKAVEEFGIKMATTTRNVALGSKKDIGEVQAAMAAFLKTGRTAGLEAFGFDTAKLDEMKSKMSEAEFAASGLDLIVSQMPTNWANLSESQNSYGANSERLNAKMDDSKAKVGEFINEGLGRLSQFITELDEKFPGLIQGITIFAAVLGVLAIAFGVLALAVLAFQLVFSPIGLIILGIVFAVGLIIAIFQNWDAIMQFLGNAIKMFFAFIGALIKNILDKVGEFFKWIGEKIGDFFKWVGEIPGKIVDFFKGIGEKIAEFFKAGIDKIKDFFIGIVDFFKSIPQKIADLFSGLGDLLKNALRFAIDLLPGFISGPLKNLLGLFEIDFADGVEAYSQVAFDTSRLQNQAVASNTTNNNNTAMTFNKGIESRHERVKLSASMNKLRGRIK